MSVEIHPDILGLEVEAETMNARLQSGEIFAIRVETRKDVHKAIKCLRALKRKGVDTGRITLRTNQKELKQYIRRLITGKAHGVRGGSEVINAIGSPEVRRSRREHCNHWIPSHSFSPSPEYRQGRVLRQIASTTRNAAAETVPVTVASTEALETWHYRQLAYLEYEGTSVRKHSSMPEAEHAEFDWNLGRMRREYRGYS